MSNIVKQPREIVASAKARFEAVENNKLDFQREAGFALQILQKNPFLAKTNPDSIRNSIINCALTGLTLNPVLKLAYLVPRKGECILDPSYMGLIKVLTDAGSVKNIYAEVVYEHDHFYMQKGTDPKIEHRPVLVGERGRKIGTYAVAFLHNGGHQFEYMHAEEVEAIKRRSEMGKKGEGSWKTDENEMWKKTIIRRLYKYLPKTEISEAVANVLHLDQQNNGIDFEAEKAARAKNTASALFEDAVEVPDDEQQEHEEAE